MKNFFFASLCLTAILFTSCKPTLPKGILDEEEMEDVLFDYYMAKSMAAQAKDSSAYKMRQYTQSVYEKHGLTEEEFNTSTKYYAKHANKLYTIYKQLDKRFGMIVPSGGLHSSFSSFTKAGDTVNVWQARPLWLLSSLGDNRQAFKLECDSTYLPGDKLIWRFSTSWLYKEANKSASAVIAVTYANDSTAAVSRGLYNANAQEVSIVLGKEKPVSVSGLIYQNAVWTPQPQILEISNISLIKYRAQKAKVEKKDTVLTASAPSDSDSLSRIQPLNVRNRPSRLLEKKNRQAKN